MKKLLLPLLFLLIVSAGANTYADSKPVDVKGWDSAKWGMTSDELKSVFGKEAKAREPREDAQEGVYSDIELSGLDWGGNEYRASLWMNSETGKLKKIVFVPSEKPGGFKWAEMFIKLEASLVDKYGDPDVEETSNDPGTSAERKWVFPSTIIEMSYLRIENTELLLLVFSENDKSQD